MHLSKMDDEYYKGLFSNKVKLSKQDLQKFANAYSLHFVLMMKQEMNY